MDTILAFCRKRGFVFGSSEIYNGFNGFYDYGPLGVELKRNIKNLWWQDMVQRRDDMYGLDTSIISSPQVWEASGHVASFSDPMVDDKHTNKRYRADQLLTASVIDLDGCVLGYVTALESDDSQRDLSRLASKAFTEVSSRVDESSICRVSDVPESHLSHIPPPGYPLRTGDLTPPRPFNLMFETRVGALNESKSKAYLRPETAQGIFVNFKNVASTARGFKVPCGIAQIGKAFRNEITPRNFIFRSREFEQMEIEYFVPPSEWEKHFGRWVSMCTDWLVHRCGLQRNLLDYEVHEKLAHYAKACTDITFKFPFGEHELQGIAARGDYDLTKHQSSSGKSLEYYDSTTHRKFLPNVIEPSVGVDRLFLAILCSAYTEDCTNGEVRTVLRLQPGLAPIKCAILPLVKNNDAIHALARSIYVNLKCMYMCEFDSTGAIGRRYRRQDEVGTPFCVTVDFQSCNDGTVTIRDRDSTQQRRIPVDELRQVIQDACVN
eukprot:CAMPEP_0198664378 /NCGR_PEP_ID=MMETSP1467-20131203/55963_1 /TAXON_ID=1462469 /ORGANISM="unid. sp., Strain CCMP2135" /LENGTH=491 /DNA_ID=CAMNT_0044400941 /DNA_START=374 /DNA_END=1849 /DNA_ORIENTATION=+